jgi:transposase
MSTNESTSTIHIGIDVAKDSLEIDPVNLGRLPRVDNSSQGLKTLLKALAKLAKKQPNSTIHIVCEATGGYERLLLNALHEAHIAVSLIQPKRVRAFAIADGILAKTDAIDAVVLTRFGQRLQPPATLPATPLQQEISDLMTRRNQFMDLLVMEKNRVSPTLSPAVCKLAECTIKHLTGQIAKIDKLIHALIDREIELKSKVERLCQLKGVGVLTAVGVLASIPELGELGRGQVASLAGLAPRNHDSGNKKGKRTIGGGRASARRALYMAAVSAARCNTKLKELYQRLVTAGKSKKLALTAVMRQMLVVMNSLIKNPEFVLE